MSGHFDFFKVETDCNLGHSFVLLPHGDLLHGSHLLVHFQVVTGASAGGAAAVVDVDDDFSQGVKIL